MKLYILPLGGFRLPKGFVAPHCTDENVPTVMPIYGYLICHPRGLVLVDTGQSYEMRDGNTVMTEDETVVARLGQLGYTPDDIDYVVMTHIHLDHAGYMSCFPNATFVVRKEELKAAWWPEICEGGYRFPLYKDTRDFKYLQPTDNEDYDLFMDGSVVLIDTKGHSRGHQSVIVTLPETGKVVLIGDAAPLYENIERMLLPGTCTNNWDAVSSLEKLRRYKAAGMLMLYGHEPEQIADIKLAPQFYV